ncbi:uncharacterized protein LOC131428780 [Malaya genurostris]|uniref:uncharacterized protein LOC131428780 n=1 Tax=Malaya genurostris TaxID=325434 RepID=UPI0026F3DFC6|nr:uncharacterized protein LOC131428780 [Malaya genurostris]
MYLFITLLLSVLVILYVYLVWNFNYWKKRNVPGPDPPFLGNMRSFFLRNRSIMDELDDIYKTYKSKYDFVGVFNVRTPRILITSPAVAKNILTKDFKSFHDNEFGQMTDKQLDPLLARNPFMLNGEEWKTKRAEITPAFTTSRIKSLFPFVEDVASRMTKYLKDHKDSPLEAKELAAKFTTDVVSSCIFDTDAQSFVKEKPEIREMGRRLFDFGTAFTLVMICRAALPRLAKILQLGMVPKSVENFFTNLMSEAIRYREEHSVQRIDYLEHLINLRNKKEITELDITAHGVTFFLDGFETSSVAISFTLYELAKNPGVQKRLRAELQDAMINNESISYDTLLELPYLEQVINEALRLWPPVALISKQCTEPFDLDLTSTRTIHLESDMAAMINIWSFHRDPEYYIDPLTFNPDRFSPATGGINPYREKGCFLPFGDGPRQCLGMRFARMQVKRAICEVVLNFAISVDSKTKEPLRLDPAQFLVTALGGIWLNFKPIEEHEQIKMFLTISLVLAALAALYVYLVWNFNYWKKRDVPGPEPTPLLGNFHSLLLRNQPVMEEMDKIYQTYKGKFNFIGVFGNRSPRIFVLSSALAKDILSKHFKNFHDNEFATLTDKEVDPILARNPFLLNGEEWKTKRAEITPAFTSSRMKSLYSIVEDVGKRMTKYLNEHKSDPLEAKELSAKFTTDVVSSCIFAADAQSFTSEKPEIREMGKKLFDVSFSSFMVLIFISMFPKLSKMLNVSVIPKSCAKFFTNLMSEAIQHRQASTTTRADYLEYLISLKNKKEISELEMAAHGVTFFLDGFETSSIAMSFILYEIARNPDVQKRLREELLEAGAGGEDITYEKLLELPYLDQVIDETLRLWTPISFMSKRCIEPIEIDLTATRKVLIETDVCAIINVWSIHRDPEYYEDPLTFNPDRFSPETGGVNSYREKGCYLPFGEGPRQCLGMRFARMQLKRGIYEVVKNFRIHVDSKTKQPLQMDASNFLTAALGGIWLNFEPIGDY